MSNYNLTVSSRFKPFSFQELLQPALMATEAHEKRQEQYDKLMEDSSKWGEQLDPSSQAYGMWKSFQDEITQAADSLSSQGLTISNRKALSNVRKSYGEKIKAIEEADKRMQAQAALRQQMQAKDNSIEYKNNLKIDDFLHGKSGSNEHITGPTMRAETADMASKLGQSIYSNPSFSKVMGGSYWQIAQANGYSPDVLGYIRSGEWQNLAHGKNASDADNKLYNDIKQVADLYTSQINRTKGYSQDAQARLGEQIFQGLYSGLEKPKYDFQRNLDYMTAAEKASNALGWANLRQRKEEFRHQKEQEKGILLPDGSRVKPIGGGRVLKTDKNGKVEIIKAPSDDSTDNSFFNSVKKQAKVSDTPVVVAFTNNKWRSGKPGDDVKGTAFGMTRSNLVSTWGNYSIDDIAENGLLVEDLKELPQGAAEEMKNAIKENNLDINKYAIVKMKASNSRAGGNYDYTLIPVDQIPKQIKNQVDKFL